MEFIKRNKKWFMIGGGALAVVVVIQVVFGPANI
jgi:hypothetical protein